MQAIFRPYKPTDKAAVLQLIRSELVPLSNTVHSLDGKLLRHLPRRLRQGVTLIAARTRSSPPLAFIHFMTGKLLFIDMLVVHSRYQGMRLGTQLMREAETHGRLHGCSRALLFVDKGNDRASRFYERLGYTIDRYDQALQCYELSKPL